MAAALVILAATLVSISFVMTFFLGNYRHDIEKWASNLLQSPVTIESAQVGWYRYQPQVSLSKVTVLDRQKHTPIVEIKKLRVFFSLLQSLWHWRLQTSAIMVSGSSLKLTQNEAGEIALQGFSELHPQPYAQETKLTDVLYWLSHEHRLILENIDVQFTGPTGIQRFITLDRLSFLNNGIKHQIFGKALLHQKLPIKVEIASTWQGDTLDPSLISANAYVYVSGFSIDQWYKGFTWRDWRVNHGMVSAKLWFNWNKGVMQQVQSLFQAYDINLYSEANKSVHMLNRISGTVGWRKSNDHHIVVGQDILIDMPTRLWPATQFYLSYRNGDSFAAGIDKLQISYLNLKDIQPYLFATPSLFSESFLTTLKGLRLRGSLENTKILFPLNWQTWRDLELESQFARLYFKLWSALPEIRNLSGLFKWNRTQGLLRFNSRQASIRYILVFPLPLDLGNINGDVKMSYQPEFQNAWRFQTSNLQIENKDLAIKLTGLLTKSDIKPTYADINSQFSIKNIGAIANYLPLRVFKGELSAWLTKAFITGAITQGNAVLQGELAKFPFKDGEGDFHLAGNVKNVEMVYAADWPMILMSSGSLVFKSDQLLMNFNRVRTVGITIPDVHGVIPFTGAENSNTLAIESTVIDTNLTQIHDFIQRTPLAKTFGAAFTKLEVQGNAKLALALKVPLANPAQTKVNGKINIANSLFKLRPWQLTFSNMHGLIDFTESTMTTNNLQGQLFNKPITINIGMLPVEDTSLQRMQANFSTIISAGSLGAWLKTPLKKYIQGETALQGKINFSFNQPPSFQLQSNLQGLSINIDNFYQKLKEENQPLDVQVDLRANEHTKVNVQYGNLLSAALLYSYKNNKYKFFGGNLNIKAGLATWPEKQGLHLFANIEKFNLGDLKNLSVSADSSDYTSAINRADIIIENFTFAGQLFNHMQINANLDQDEWHVRFAHPDLTGMIQLPIDYTQDDLISARFKNMNLKISPADSGLTLDVKTLPAISFTGEHVTFNGKTIGQVTFKSIPANDGMEIQILGILSPNVDIKSSGEWRQINGNQITSLNGSGISKNVSQFLKDMDLAISNFEATEGRIGFDVRWEGTLLQPNLATMDGKGAINLGKGRVVNVGREADAKMDLGRMISIFSLQTIPRRLSLDFSDVFQKGYSFDSLRGDFIMQNGNLRTSNLQFDGPVAQVGIDGLISLNKEEYNLILSVTPNVTSSIPVAATLLTGQPWIGLAALAVNTVIGSQVSKASSYQYKVTGPWKNPSWTPINNAMPKK